MLDAVPPIAVGAIGAAIIAALVSLLGLIISKEQKTSEFRQAWIDGLRCELTTYLSELNAVTDAASAEYESHAKKIEALGERYSNLNKANFAIILRLNQHEERSQDLLKCMQEFHDLAANNDLTVASIRHVEPRLLGAAKDVLKTEWKRVKGGELTFRIAKYVALGFMTALIGLSLFALLSPGSFDGRGGEKGLVPQPQITNQK